MNALDGRCISDLWDQIILRTGTKHVSRDNYHVMLNEYTQFIKIYVDVHDNRITHQGCRKLLSLAFNNRGHVHYLLVNFDEALQDYNKAININPDLSVAYYNRGTVKYRMGEFETAISDFKYVINSQNTNSDKLMNAADEAIVACEKGIAARKV